VTRLRRIARLRGYAAPTRQAILTVAVLVTVGSSPVLACPVCFGAEETAMIDGTKLGIAVLLAITIAVQGAFAAFFFYLRRRAKQLADVDLDSEWSELQKVSRTS
jgi:heme/copper-type cytochrome/quinol oxidase subunit 2